MSAYPELVRQMPCYEPRHMREHTARPHKLLYGFNGEMFWNIALRGDPIEEEEEEGKGVGEESVVGGVPKEKV